MIPPWDSFRLKHLARNVIERAAPHDDRPYIGLDAIAPWTGEIDLSASGETEESTGNRFNPGDILFGKLRPYLAKVSAPKFAGQCSAEALVLRPKPHIDPRFLRYRLVDVGAIDAVNASTYGAKMPRASWDFIGNMRFSIPDLPTQKAIADFLDRETGRVDRLIEKKQRLVELLREKLRATTSNYFEVLEKNNTTQWRLRHLLREPLKYGANESSDSDDADGVRFIRITDLGSDGTLRDDNVKVLPLDKAQPYMLCDGDILLARSGATVGKSFIYRDAFGPCCFAGYLIRARLRLSVILPDFLKRFTETARYWDFIAQSNIQATIQNVSAERYANLLIPLPSIAHQVEILDGIEKLEAPLRCALAQVNKSVERLREFRATLITAAVTGQIDVATWGKRGQADCRLDALQREMTS